MTQRKIVAIGGGETGRIRTDGTHCPDEHMPIMRTIIALSGKSKPHVLILAHSQPKPQKEQNYLSNMLNALRKWQLPMRCLRRATIVDAPDAACEALRWADIIYEGGGDTGSMLKYWRKTGFDMQLRAAWEAGKVMCGVSAGANCWFTRCSSKGREQIGDDPATAMLALDGLGFLPGFFVPHANVPGRLEHMEQVLCGTDAVGLALSDCAAMVIVDGQYRLIAGEPARAGFLPYALRAAWRDGEYHCETIEMNDEYRPFAELFQ